MDDGLNSVAAFGFEVALFSGVHGSLSGIEAQAEAGFATRRDGPTVLGAGIHGGEALGEASTGDDEVTQGVWRVVLNGNARGGVAAAHGGGEAEGEEAGELLLHEVGGWCQGAKDPVDCALEAGVGRVTGGTDEAGDQKRGSRMLLCNAR